MEVGNTPLIKLSDKLYGKLEAVNPGGSIKDGEVISACNKYGIAMVFTKKRCFKH